MEVLPVLGYFMHSPSTFFSTETGITSFIILLHAIFFSSCGKMLSDPCRARFYEIFTATGAGTLTPEGDVGLPN
jgi:hypothetical protein